MSRNVIKAIFYGTVNAFAGGLLGFAGCINVIEIRFLNHIFYQSSYFATSTGTRAVCVLSGSLLLLAMFILFSRKTRPAYAAESALVITSVSMPLWLFSIYLLPIRPGFWSAIMFTIVTGWWVYRLCLLLNLGGIPDVKIPNWGVFLILGVLFGFAVMYGFSLQKKSLDIMYLTFYDWGEFVTIARNIARGKGFVTNDTLPGINYLGRHFSPGSLAIIALYLKIFPTSEAFFLFNSALLYSMPILIYLLARKGALPTFPSLILSLAAFLSPSLSCLNLTSFHGFHTISFMIPALILFFIFFETKRYKWAFGIFLLSLTIQETVPVVWLGLSVVFVCFGDNRNFWLALGVISITYWLITMKTIIPFIAESDNYLFVQRYDHLGSTIAEIAASPFLLPGAFWGSLFRVDCIYFIVLLLLPVFILAIANPFVFIGSALTLVFVCLQHSNRFQNITAQYQTEAMTMAFICAVFAAVSLAKREKNIWLEKILGVGLPASIHPRQKIDRDRIFSAALISTLFTASLSHYFFAQSDWSKYSFSHMRQKKDRSETIALLKNIIPRDAPLNASQHLAAHFVFCNDVYPVFNILLDYVLIDLDDPYDPQQQVAAARRYLLTSDKYSLLYNKAFQDMHIMLFGPSQNNFSNKKSRNIIRISEEQWQSSGKLLAIPNLENFSVRAILEMSGEQLFVAVLVRLEQEIDYDIKIRAVIGDGQRKLYFSTRFGDGVEPAYLSEKGSVFLMPLPVPANWKKVQLNDVRIEKTL